MAVDYLSNVKTRSASEIKAFYTTFDLPFLNQPFHPRQALSGVFCLYSIIGGYNSS